MQKYKLNSTYVRNICNSTHQKHNCIANKYNITTHTHQIEFPQVDTRSLYPEDRGNMFLQNAANHLKDHMASQLKNYH